MSAVCSTCLLHIHMVPPLCKVPMCNVFSDAMFFVWLNGMLTLWSHSSCQSWIACWWMVFVWSVFALGSDCTVDHSQPGGATTMAMMYAL